MSIRVDGIEDLVSTLREMEGAARAEVLADAAMEAIEPLRRQASRTAPRRTGRLVRSFSKEVAEKRKGFAAIETGPHPHGFYAYMLEFGWWAMGTRRAAKGKGVRGKGIGISNTRARKKAELPNLPPVQGTWQSPRPFIRPAIDNQKEAVFAQFMRAISRWFDSIR